MRRISIGNTVFEGENNAYLSTGTETVLVDTGIATSETRDRFAEQLGDEGVDLVDVDRIFLTHYHADHSGLAGEIQRRSGATVHVHPADAPLVEGDDGAWDDYWNRLERLFEEWGMPREKRSELRSYMDSGSIDYGEGVEVETIGEGDRFATGDGELRVLHTPGHTHGSCSFVLEDRNEVLTGDALLPVYTPNVGGADVRLDRPLERYLETLRGLADAGFDRAWPGHRDPISDPTARARTIVEHHEQRARRVLDAVESLEPTDAWSVSAELFGHLENIHVLHGPGEAYAHLDHLVGSGALRVDDGEYRLADGTRERLAETDGDSWSLSD